MSGHQVRLDEGQCRNDKSGQIHGSNQAAPVPRDECRVQNTKVAEGSVQNVSDDPCGEAIHSVREEVSGGSVLASLFLARQTQVEQGLQPNPANHSESSFLRDMWAVVEADGPETFFYDCLSILQKGSLVSGNGDEDGYRREWCQKARQRCDCSPDPGPLEASTPPDISRTW